MTDVDEVADVFCQFLLNQSIHSCESLESALKKADQSQEFQSVVYSQITVEFLYVYLHLSDRELFRQCGADTRSRFMVMFVNTIEKLLSRTEVSQTYPRLQVQVRLEDKAKFSDVWHDAYAKLEDAPKPALSVFVSLFSFDELNNRNCQYVGYNDIVPADEKPLKDSVGYKVGEVVSCILGQPLDLRVVLHAHNHVSTVYKSLIKLMSEIQWNEL